MFSVSFRFGFVFSVSYRSVWIFMKFGLISVFSVQHGLVPLFRFKFIYFHGLIHSSNVTRAKLSFISFTVMTHFLYTFPFFFGQVLRCRGAASARVSPHARRCLQRLETRERSRPRRRSHNALRLRPLPEMRGFSNPDQNLRLRPIKTRRLLRPTRLHRAHILLHHPALVLLTASHLPYQKEQDS